MHEIKVDLNIALKLEETYWKQKSKIKWLNDGDANNRFFHSSVRATTFKLGIKKIKDDNN